MGSRAARAPAGRSRGVPTRPQAGGAQEPWAWLRSRSTSSPSGLEPGLGALSAARSRTGCAGSRREAQDQRPRWAGEGSSAQAERRLSQGTCPPGRLCRSDEACCQIRSSPDRWAKPETRLVSKETWGSGVRVCVCDLPSAAVTNDHSLAGWPQSFLSPSLEGEV